MLEFRLARPQEAAFHARVYTLAGPDEPITAAGVREAWAAAPPESRRYTILEEGAPIGIAGVAHPAWESGQPRVARLEVEILPDRRSHLNLGRAFDFVEGQAEEAGAEHLVTHARESDGFLILHLRRRGYGGRQVFSWRQIDLNGRAAGLAAARREAAGKLSHHRFEHLQLEAPGAAGAYPGVRPDLSWVAYGPDGELEGAALISMADGNPWLELAGAAAPSAELKTALELHALSSAAEAGLKRVRSEGAAEGDWKPVPGMIGFHVEVDERRRRRAIPRI